jgi:hypothetical protein
MEEAVHDGKVFSHGRTRLAVNAEVTEHKCFSGYAAKNIVWGDLITTHLVEGNKKTSHTQMHGRMYVKFFLRYNQPAFVGS